MFNWATVIVSLVINWFIAGILCAIIMTNVGFPLIGSFVVTPEILSTLVVIILISLSFLPPIDTIFKWFYKLRLPIRDERTRVQPLVDAVCQKACMDPDRFKLYICSDQFPNAYALGINIIAVSRGLLKVSNDDEIKAILAHEIAHHKNGDCIATRIYITVSLLGQFCLLTARFVKNLIPNIFLLKVLCFPVFLVLTINIYILEFLLFIPLLIAKIAGSRFQEYDADRFAAQLGYGQELYDFLYKIIDNEASPLGFWNILYKTHPSPANRMRRLERYI